MMFKNTKGTKERHQEQELSSVWTTVSRVYVHTSGKDHFVDLQKSQLGILCSYSNFLPELLS
jgi:hypothetical protein